MSIISPSDFIGEVNIPNSDKPVNAASLQSFIDKYEPKFLKSLMGSDLYAEYLLTPDDTKWTALLADSKPLIVNYVYYWYTRNQVTYNSGIGVVKAKSENSVAMSADDKLTFAWNEMVTGVWEICGHWDVTLYGSYYLNGFYGWYLSGYNWMGYQPDIFSKINSYNI